RQVAPKRVSTGNMANRRPRPAAHAHTKMAKVIALLQRPEGATLQAIMRATSWQTHSVRGFISGQLKKKLGLKVRSFQRGGERVYSIKRGSGHLLTALAPGAAIPSGAFVGVPSMFDSSKVKVLFTT